MRRSGWLDVAEEARLHNECDQIMAILTSKMRDLSRAMDGSPQIREANTTYDVPGKDDRPLFPFTEDDYSDEEHVGL